MFSDYSCALQRDILIHGRLYVTQCWLCFYANIFSWETLVSNATACLLSRIIIYYCGFIHTCSCTCSLSPLLFFFSDLIPCPGKLHVHVHVHALTHTHAHTHPHTPTHTHTHMHTHPQLTIPFQSVEAITKEKTALVIPNAIQISTSADKYGFSSLVNRDITYNVIFKCWQNSLLDHVGVSLSLSLTSSPSLSFSLLPSLPLSLPPFPLLSLPSSPSLSHPLFS